MIHPLIIQGGMGVGVSNWRLARAVSTEGELGVVSGTAINSVLIRRLQRGDPGGHMQRALACFPDQHAADSVLKKYFVSGGIPQNAKFKLSTVPSLRPTASLQRLLAIAGFVEVWLAKEGHDGIIGINFLEKLQTSNLPAIYGAMLAGVDYILMGAGVPREIPGVLNAFTEHQKASIHVSVRETSPSSNTTISFDPHDVFPLLVQKHHITSLRRPYFFPIISNAALASHLSTKSNGVVDGFVIEGVLAGGHNAPPRGQLKLNERGEPIYGPKDNADLEAIRQIGLPFWLAGSYGSPGKLREALLLGAAGVQVGTAFAFCNESGLLPTLRQQVIHKWIQHSGTDVAAEDTDAVFTDPLASPTGFPFKVVHLHGTLSETSVYEARPRKCDIGYLRQIALDSDGKFVYLCPAEPIRDFVQKGGNEGDTVNRKCLCNALLANIGLGQIQDNAYHEPPLLTAGNDLVNIGQFLQDKADTYSAKDVLDFMKN